MCAPFVFFLFWPCLLLHDEAPLHVVITIRLFFFREYHLPSAFRGRLLRGLVKGRSTGIPLPRSVKRPKLRTTDMFLAESYQYCCLDIHPTLNCVLRAFTERADSEFHPQWSLGVDPGPRPCVRCWRIFRCWSCAGRTSPPVVTGNSIFAQKSQESDLLPKVQIAKISDN